MSEGGSTIRDNFPPPPAVQTTGPGTDYLILPTTHRYIATNTEVVIRHHLLLRIVDNPEPPLDHRR